MPIYKFCYPCQTEKTIEDFYRNKNTKDGHSRVCKKCEYARYNVHAVKQRDIVNPNPFERARSKENAALRFLEKMLFTYGADTYIIDKTVNMIAADTGVPSVSVFRHLHNLLKLGLLTRKYHNPKDRSMGYDWYVCMNKPSN